MDFFTVRAIEKVYIERTRVVNFIKGTVQRDFRPHSNQPGPLTNELKYFTIFVKFSLSYLNFYESLRGIILRSVNLPRV